MRLVLHGVGGCERAAEVKGVQVEVVGDGTAHEAGPGRGPDLRVRVEWVVDYGFWGRLREEVGRLDVFEGGIVYSSDYDDVADWAFFVAAVVELCEG